MSCCRPDAARTPSADPLAAQLLPARCQSSTAQYFGDLSVSDALYPLTDSDILQNYTHTRARAFNGPFYGTTRVSWYQKGKPIWILLKQETVSGSGINWAICKSVPRSRQITTPPVSFFYRPDALPAAQPTASKHWRQTSELYSKQNLEVTK